MLIICFAGINSIIAGMKKDDIFYDVIILSIGSIMFVIKETFEVLFQQFSLYRF